MDRSHHHHQPPTDQPPETPESRTKSENTSQRPIQSTKASAVNHPCNHGHTANRSTSTIRRHHKDQPPGHRPRNRPAPRTESEIARRHRNQSTPASGHTRPLKLFTPIKVSIGKRSHLTASTDAETPLSVGRGFRDTRHGVPEVGQHMIRCPEPDLTMRPSDPNCMTCRPKPDCAVFGLITRNPVE